MREGPQDPLSGELFGVGFLADGLDGVGGTGCGAQEVLVVKLEQRFTQANEERLEVELNAFVPAALGRGGG